MSDYLSKLATKNIGTAEFIQPRRAARFEPLQTPFDAQAEALFFQPESFDIGQSFEDERGGIDTDLISHRARSIRKDELMPRRKNDLMPRRDDFDEQVPQASPDSPAKARPQIKKQIRKPVAGQSKMVEEVQETINEILPSPKIVATKKSLLAADEQIPPLPVSPAKAHSPVTEQMEERVSVQTKIIEKERETTNGTLSSPRPALPTIVTPPKSLLTPRAAPSETKTTDGNTSIQPRLEPKTIELKNPATKSSEPPVIERRIIEKQVPIIAKPRVSTAENHFIKPTANRTEILPPREKTLKQIAESPPASDVPVINVTIGRVEVRAVVSNTPIKETRPKSQTLSLDEYLRQRRSGGER